MDDQYSNVAGGKLKLKGGPDTGKVKKKKKKSHTEKISREALESNLAGNEKNQPEEQKTEAQKNFEERQRKREEERIMKKASKSHKEKVEELNKYLDSLSEHYDVPKVSWTK